MRTQPFQDPTQVTSPKERLKLRDVIFNGGADDISVAEGIWDDKPMLLMRWNGNADHPKGNPQSRGLPTWFVVPNWLEDAVRAEATKRASK